MEHVIFGFGKEMRRYTQTEIFLYLILFSIMAGAAGKAALEEKASGQYMALIRYGTFSAWWHSVVLRMLKISILLTAALFECGTMVLSLTKTVRTGAEWQTAFLLWSVSFCTITFIQAIFVQFRNGYKIVFALIMCMAVVSLYVPWLPGSWLMFERSAKTAENGFSVWGVCLFQILFDAVTACFGYRLFRPRRGHEAGN